MSASWTFSRLVRNRRCSIGQLPPHSLLLCGASSADVREELGRLSNDWARFKIAAQCRLGAPDQVSTALRAINNFALGYQMLDDIADADADAVAGEVNAVTIMSVAGAADPERAVRDRALTHLDRAAEIAQSLPATIPDIVSGYIEMLLHRAGVRDRVQAVASGLSAPRQGRRSRHSMYARWHSNAIVSR